MSHELTIRKSGQVEMAYLDGVSRWHGLGNELQSDATIDDWIIAAGMDWKAQRAMVRFATSRDAHPTDYKTYGDLDNGGKVVLFRNDNHYPLGIVSTDYKIVQPRQILEFWRDLVSTGGMQLQTAGTLFGGRKLWALAKVGEAKILDPRNIVRENLLIATSLDGSMATEAFYCTTVVVCNNTLRLAQDEKQNKIKINHRSTFDPQKVKAELGIEAAKSNFEKILISMRDLAEKRIASDHAVELTCELIKPGYFELDNKEKHKVQNSKPLHEIMTRFLDQKVLGHEFDGMNGTTWGWLNSITEYVDHAARASNADNRLNSAFFGKGSETKTRAFAMAEAYTPTNNNVLRDVNSWISKHNDGNVQDLI